VASYPGSIWAGHSAPATLAGPPTHETMHEDVSGEIVAMQTELGTNPSGSLASVAVRLDGYEAAWTTYTPALTATTTSPTLGTGSAAAGRYIRIGKTVHFFASITFGSSGVAAGSGTYQVSLPVSFRSDWRGSAIGQSVLSQGGTEALRHVRGIADLSDNKVEIVSEAGVYVTHAVPIAWAANHIIRVAGTYEAA
jgi:hypothetical protein